MPLLPFCAIGQISPSIALSLISNQMQAGFVAKDKKLDELCLRCYGNQSNCKP